MTKSLIEKLKEAIARNPWDLLGEDRTQDKLDLEQEQDRKDLECYEAMSHLKDCQECFVNSKWICPECGEVRKRDERVKVGMKCGQCAYVY